MDADNFKKLCREGKIRWSSHGLARMHERDISVADVKNCLMNGEIIEEYPDDFPKPSALIFGYASENKIIHVVCGLDEEFLYFITAYVPNTIKFLDDLKTRRKK